MTRLENDFHDEFSSASRQPWHTSKSKALAGEVRFASGGAGGAGNYTFVRVYEAGYVYTHSFPISTVLISNGSQTFGPA